MEIRLGDIESELSPYDDLVSQIGHYASSHFDARHAAQMIGLCRTIPEGLDTHFQRRGLIDGAVITYMRCFAASKRTQRADALPLLEFLTEDEREIHDAVNEWRHDHAAHRTGKRFEDIETTLLWPGFGSGLPEVRVRLATAFRPDLPEFERRFEELAVQMSILIWEQRMFPLQQQILQRIGPKKLEEMRRSARTKSDHEWPGPILGVKINVGSKPPPSDPRRSFLESYPPPQLPGRRSRPKGSKPNRTKQ